MSLYVINIYVNQRKEPLMPTTLQKIRRLFKEGKAKVVETNPFTIQKWQSKI